MKTKLLQFSRALVIGLPAVIYLWTGSGAPAQIPPAARQTTPGEYVCVQRGPNSKVWQRAVLQTNASGIVRTNVHSYTELATGISYLQNGEYVDSVEEIDPVADGAQAIQGRHKVHWAANANTQRAVTLTTPDGKTLSSTVFGLLYYDTSSGSNVLLTQLQDCAATINANTLTYGNAFSNLTADIRYTYRKSGLSQDIILRQQPPSPSEYGMDPASTYLQVMTEFFDPPAPEQTTVMQDGAENAINLSFGEMKMGVGHAFLFQNDVETVDGVPVAKIWTNIDSRTFLIEQVPYSSISNQLSSLHSSLIKPDRGRVRRTVMLDRPGRAGTPRNRVALPSDVLTLPAVPPTRQSSNPVKVGKSMSRGPGLVLDYELLSSVTNLTLQGDTTYLLTGGINVTGTLTIEGGTVVKYTNSPEAQLDMSNIVCQTAPYRPGVFTSMDDNSVGETINGSTGVPVILDGGGYLCPTLRGASIVLTNLRFSYAAVAIWANPLVNSNSSIAISDCQFVACATAFDGYLGYTYSGTNAGFPIYLHNVLFSRCDETLSSTQYGSSEDYFSLRAVNITADQVGTFVGGELGVSNVCYATNCLFTAVTNLSGITNFTDCVTNASGAGIYQTVGAASYYLADGSTNRGAGTTNIDPNLLADLQMKTTYPPVVVMPPSYFTNDSTFFPQAQRDNGGSTVDIGYHYDPLDYALYIALSNVTVTVLPGTALATMGPYEGIYFDATATFNCFGTATSPNYLVRYNTVQEQSNTNWVGTYWYGSIYGTSRDDTPVSGNFRFTEWSALAGDVQFYVDYDYADALPFSFQDCQFYNGTMLWWGLPIVSTNCLFQRVNIVMTDGGNATTNTICNNLFWEGELDYAHYDGDGGTWTFRDNLFDQTAITVEYEGTTPTDIFSNNAYVTTNFGTITNDASNVILTESPAYETGTLGEYYYPTSQTDLIHKGSQSAAAAGLYHYTVTTNNAIEGTNIVSIGFHYVACTNGVPLDSNGDGMPDYLEDSNGNGLVDSGEIAWDIPGDLGLTVVITQPANNSRIP